MYTVITIIHNFYVLKNISLVHDDLLQGSKGSIGGASTSIGHHVTALPSNDGGGASGFITVGYRGTFAFGRDGLADVQFRKLLRIIVCGKVIQGVFFRRPKSEDSFLGNQYTKHDKTWHTHAKYE